MAENKVYESIMEGLNEALEDAQSPEPILKRYTVVVETNNEKNDDENQGKEKN